MRIYIFILTILLNGIIGFAQTQEELQDENNNIAVSADTLQNTEKENEQSEQAAAQNDTSKETKVVGQEAEIDNHEILAMLFTWDKILLLVLTVIVIVLIVSFIIDKKKRREEILFTLTGRKSNNRTPRLDELIDNIVERSVKIVKQGENSVNNASKATEDEVKQAIEDLQKRLAQLEDGDRKISHEVSKYVELEIPKMKETVPSPKTLYADTISGGVFNRITEQPDDDTVFELQLKTPTDKIATFTVYSGAYRRVLKNADFVEGCDKQRLSQQANNLEVERGVVHLQDNGKWQITQKAKIKFV